MASTELVNGASNPDAGKPGGAEGGEEPSVAPAGLAVQETETLEQKLEKIPSIEFVEDVDAFMLLPENAQNAQETLKRIEDLHHRMKVLEASNVSTKRRLQGQLSEFEKALEVIDELKARNAANESLSTHFRLADHVYLKAKIKPNQKIGLWLGANVMLEYDIEEGEALLVEKKGKAEDSLRMTNTLIDTIREQLTTIEVNMARIYNWDVKRRQQEKEQMLAKKE